MTWLKRDRAAVKRYGLLYLTSVEEDITEQIVGSSIIGLQADGGAVRLLGFVVTPFVEQGLPQTFEGAAVFRAELDCFLEERRQSEVT